MQGMPGQPNYRSPQLFYRINVGGSGKTPFPIIDFAVESSAGALFQRHFELPGNDFLEPGPPIDRAVALDPVAGEDWAKIYEKADSAKFKWSVKGKSSGGVEKPLHKAWP